VSISNGSPSPEPFRAKSRDKRGTEALIFTLFSDNSHFERTIEIPSSLTVGRAQEGRMIAASDLKTGAILQIEKNLYKVLATEYHMGGGKMGGLVHAKLKDVRTGLVLERKFKPDEKLDKVELDRRTMEYLYEDIDGFYMMDPETYEQILLNRNLVETFSSFLQPNMKLPVEFLEDEPVNVLFPEWVELEVTSTPPSISSLQDEVYKPATLANGMVIQVPQFIKVADVVKVNVASKKYIERATKR
jgi:elongation factor P